MLHIPDTTRRPLAVLALLAALAPPAAALAADCQDYEGGMRWLSRLDFGFSGNSDVALQGNLAYVAMNKIKIVNVTDPADPHYLNEIYAGWANPRAIALDGNLLAAAVWDGGVELYSLSNPTDPIFLSRSPLAARATSVHLRGDIVFAGSIDRGLVVLDASVPESPVELARIPGEVDHLRGLGDHVYAVFDAGSGNELRVYDVSDPANPVLTHNWGASVLRAMPNGGRLYVSQALDGVAVFDLSNPALPVLLGTQDTVSFVQAANGFGDWVFPVYSSQSTLECWHAPGGPPWELVSALPTAFGPDVLIFHEGLAYVPGSEELEIFDLSQPDGGAELLGYYENPTNHQMLAVAAGGGVAYVTNDGNLIGQNHVEAYDLSDLADIGPLDHVVYQGTAPTDLALAGGLLYVADLSGVDVVDVSDPSAMARVGRVDTPGDARQVDVVGDLLLIADGDPGLQVASLASDPTAPVIVGNLQFFQDAHAVTAFGDHALLLVAGGTLKVVDISDPAAPVEASELGGFPGGERIAAQDGLAYVGANAEVKVVDLANPAAPAIVGTVSIPGYATDVAVRGGALYVAAGGQGLQVIDVSEPTAPRHIGGLDLPGESHGVAIGDAVVCLASLARLNVAPRDCLSATAIAGEAPAAAPFGLAAHPNPFNPATRLRFVLDEPAAASLAVYDASGRRVRTLLDGARLPAGEHALDWDGRGGGGEALASGVYLVELRAGGRRGAEKLTLLR